MDEGCLVPIIIVAASIVIGAAIGNATWRYQGCRETDVRWQKEMIRRGYAEHDAKTGEWKWTDGKGSLETNKE